MEIYVIEKCRANEEHKLHLVPFEKNGSLPITEVGRQEPGSERLVPLIWMRIPSKKSTAMNTDNPRPYAARGSHRCLEAKKAPSERRQLERLLYKESCKLKMIEVLKRRL